MTNTNSKWLATVAASMAVATLGGCHDDVSTVPATPAPAASIPFSVFATQAFSNSANSTPVSLSGFTFLYDVDDQPAYFNAQIAMGVY